MLKVPRQIIRIDGGGAAINPDSCHGTCNGQAGHSIPRPITGKLEYGARHPDLTSLTTTTQD